MGPKRSSSDKEASHPAEKEMKSLKRIESSRLCGSRALFCAGLATAAGVVMHCSLERLGTYPMHKGCQNGPRNQSFYRGFVRVFSAYKFPVWVKKLQLGERDLSQGPNNGGEDQTIDPEPGPSTFFQPIG